MIKIENKSTDLVNVKNFLDYDKKIETNDKTFEQLMFVYMAAIKEVETKLEIIKQESKIFNDYEIIDNMKTRIKTPESIVNKMKKKGLEINYKEMIENINDIAGIRVVTPLKEDIYEIEKLIRKIPEINVLREKDYVENPKESGYSAYHIILAVPVVLSTKLIYVKVEVQIRTMAMDVWASLEHKMKYKTQKAITNKQSKEWINCAKAINKIDEKITNLTIKT